MVVSATLVVTLLQVAGFGPFSTPPSDASVAPTVVTLSTNKASFLAGQNFTLTATTDVSVQGSGSSIEIVDQTTYTTLKTCTTGKVCTISTSFTTGDPHVYVAHVGSLVSDIVTVGRELWTIALTSSRDTLIAGQRALLTATANQSVTSTGGAYAIDIFDVTARVKLKTCTVGKVCTVYSDPFYVDDQYAHEFVALVAAIGGAASPEDETGVQASSESLVLSRAQWQVTLANDLSSLSAGESVVSTLSADQNVGLTNGKYAMYIVDMVTGSVKKACTTGTVCQTMLPWSGTETGYALVGFIAAAGTPATFEEMTDIQAGYGADWLPLSDWEANVTVDRSEMGAGDTVTVTATTNQNVGRTSGKYVTYIYEGITGRLLKTCSSGTVCTVTDSFYGPTDPFYVPYSYFALVAAPGGPSNTSGGLPEDYKAISNWERVERQEWVISGEIVNDHQFRITSNQDPGKTGGRVAIYMFDGSSEASDPEIGSPRVDSPCYSGTICIFSAPIGVEKTYMFWVAPRPAPEGASDAHVSCCVFASTTYYHPSEEDPAGPTLSGETTGGSNPSENPCQCSHADPVNTATGEFFLPATDISISGVGPALEVARTYSTSNASVDGVFGFGWSSRFNAKLAAIVGGTAGDPRPRQVEITQENGSAVLFTKLGESYVAPSRVFATLSRDPATGVWTFTRNQTEVMIFSAAGAVTSMSDLHGNALQIGHDGAGKLDTVTASGTRYLEFEWTGTRISSVIDSAGRSVSYEYDGQGNLIRMTGVDGSITTYLYDLDHFMTQVELPGAGTTSNAYDTSGRIVNQTDPIARVTTFSYSGAETTIVHPDGSRTVEAYTNGVLASQTVAEGTPEEATTSFKYDERLNVVEIVDALGGVSAMSYDGNGNVLTKTDALGNVTSYTYGPLSKVTSTTDPLGRVTTATYDLLGNVLTMSTPSGRTSTWTYNANGTIATATDPLGAATSYAYDAAGRIASVTDPDGRTTSFGYDVAGNGTQVTGSDGSVATNAFDVAGRLLSTTDPLGHVTSYGYDAAGNRDSVTDPSLIETTSISDAADQVISVTDGAGEVTLYSYTSAGQLETVTDALNHVATRTYDATGRMASSTDPLGRVTHFEYDLLGRLLVVTSPSGAARSSEYDLVGRLVSSTDANDLTTYYDYDLAGQLVSVTDPLGRVWEIEYNLDGQRTQVIQPDSSSVVLGYDGVGRLVTYTNADGRSTTYSYLDSGLLAAKTEPGTLATSYTYDAGGRLGVQTNPDGSALVYEYDAAGRVSLVDFSDIGATDSTYTYDDSNRVEQITDASGSTSFTYDGTGRLVGETDGSGDSISYDYDEIGQMVSLTYPSGHQVSYVYDDGGQLTSLTDWASNTTAFLYTEDGQLATQTLPNGVVQTAAYDPAGQLLELSVSNSSTLLADFTYTYDNAGQLATNGTTLDGITSDEEYGYDPLSQLASVGSTIGGGGPTSATVHATPAGSLTTSQRGETLVYGDGQELVSLTPLLGSTITYGYDGNGSRVASTTPSASPDPDIVTTLSYTAAGHLASVQSPTDLITYASDARGLRQSRTTTVGTADFTWSTAAGLALLLEDGEREYIYGTGSAPIAQVDSTGAIEYLTGDIIGSTRLITDSAGAQVGTQTFDAFGARTAHSGATGSAFGFSGNWTDPATGYVYLRARDYDPATGQFLTVDPAVDSTRQPYAYAGNNPLLVTDPTGLDWISDASGGLVAFKSFVDDAVGNIGAGLLGAADAVTGGLSTEIIRAVAPGVDCFIEEHDTAFGAGQIVGTIADIVVSTALIVTGVGGLAVLGAVAAKFAARTVVKAVVPAVKKIVKSVVERVAERRGARSAANASDDTLRTVLSPASNGVPINSQTLNYTATVLGKAKERPYIGNTLLIDEITSTASRVDPGGVATALRWDAAGSFNGSRGSFGLVIDTATNTVLHFGFESIR